MCQKTAVVQELCIPSTPPLKIYVAMTKQRQHSTPKKRRTVLLTTACAYRKQLQKLEFLACWLIALLMTGTHLSPTLPVLFIQISTVTRFMAYAVDFTKALVKFNGSIPMWLVLHHSGVMFQHITKAFLLAPSSQVQVIFSALASQSSHNSWTKNYSLVLYWGNVLVGVFTCSHLHISHGEGNAALWFYWCLIVTSVGILLLVLETQNMFNKHVNGKVTLWATDINVFLKF